MVKTVRKKHRLRRYNQKKSKRTIRRKNRRKSRRKSRRTSRRTSRGYVIDLNESTLYGGGKENSPPASVESLKSELKILKENENKLEVNVNDLRKNKKKLKTELGSLKGIIFTKMGSTDLNLNLFFNK